MTEENDKKKVRTTSALNSIQTGHLPNMCQKHYHSSQLAQLHKLQERQCDVIQRIVNMDNMMSHHDSDALSVRNDYEY